MVFADKEVKKREREKRNIKRKLAICVFIGEKNTASRCH